MSRWFRFYEESLNDPKLLRLSDALYRAWTMLLCFASKNDGILPAADDMAAALRAKPSKVSDWIEKLVSAGLIDRVGDHYEPHNWNGRQYRTDKPDETAAERMRRYRERKRVSSVTVTPVTQRNTVTVTVPRTDTDTDTEKNRRVAAPSSDFEFEDFWNVWPNKVGKPAALKAFVSARKRAGLDAIVDGVLAYVRDRPPDRSWLNPATFLNQNRWEDQPAQVQNGKPKSAIIQAADNLCRTIAGFDGPPRDPDELRGEPRETPARLLSHG